MGFSYCSRFCRTGAPSYGARKFLMLAWLFLSATAMGSPLLAQNLSQTELERLQAAFNAGNAALTAGNAQQATEKYAEAISIAPTFPLPYVNRGVALLSLSKNTEALADANKALSLLESDKPSSLVNYTDVPSHSAIAYQVKGTAYQNLGEYRTATDAFSKSIELVPSQAKFRNSRGNAYRMLKDYAAALKDFDKAIELDGSIALFYINRGSVYLRLKNIEAALKDVDEALRLDKTNESAFYTRGNAYVELKKFPEALADYNQAISLKPKSQFFHGRARVYFMQGKFDLAVKDHGEALAIDPSNANAYADRAVAYSRLGKDALAIDDVRKALELKGESAVMRHTLAYLLYRTRQYSLSVTEATKVIASAPKWRDPYLVRANAYAKLGNMPKAKADTAIAATLKDGGKPVEDFLVFELDVFVPVEKEQ